MNRALSVLSIVMLIILISSGCALPQKASTHSNGTEKPTVIAEAAVDYDQNGVEEKLYVRMMSGESKEEKEIGTNMGTYWEGQFRLELIAKDSTLLHALDLNPTFNSGPLIFNQSRQFVISFADYNNDGSLDFSIGQSFTSNGSTFNLYSLLPEGIAVLHQGLFTADNSYSTAYEKAGNTSFINRYYDMDKGKEAQTLYTWQGERFVRTECEGCELKTGDT